MRNLVKLIIIAFISNVCFTQCSSDNNIVEEIIEEIEKDSTITEEPKDSVIEEIDSAIVAEVPNPLFQLMMNDSNITLFVAALEATGLYNQLECVIDSNYNPGDYPWYYYRSDIHNEVSTVPDRKMNAYTLFVETDSILKWKYSVLNFDDLKIFSKQIYDATFPQDAGIYDDDMTHPKNPLYRFVAYHILKCKIHDMNFLTGKILNEGPINGPIGIRTDKMNPIEWYQTLLPNTMIKCEMLTMQNWAGNDILNNYYLNRKWDNFHQIRGSEVNEPKQENSTINGIYFYVDDIVAFTSDVRDKVHDMLIRMDFSTIFPELITHNIRLNGDPMKEDNDAVADETFRNGRNYYFPMDYLDGVTFGGDCHIVYRRPHLSYYIYCGDEMNLFGDYDFEFRLPPVPYSGEWQIRLGYSITATRGVAQVYFDDVPQGIPLDMRKRLDDETIMGDAFSEKNYSEMTAEERAEDQKALKNKGYYRGPAGGYYSTGLSKFETEPSVARRVLCQVYIDNKEDHYLRIRCASKNKIGNNDEFSLDYLELVPKSIYDIPDGEMESDL